MHDRIFQERRELALVAASREAVIVPTRLRVARAARFRRATHSRLVIKRASWSGGSSPAFARRSRRTSSPGGGDRVGHERNRARSRGDGLTSPLKMGLTEGAVPLFQGPGIMSKAIESRSLGPD